jgi:hypothetical protein
MAIPDDAAIQEELLQLLGSSPQNRIHASEAYSKLVELHPELTNAEVSEPYRNSVSHWANRVQFARLHLVERGLVYRAGAGPTPRSGVWILTDRGKDRIRELALSGETEELTQRVREDLRSREIEDELFQGKMIARLTSHYERNLDLRSAAPPRA